MILLSLFKKLNLLTVKRGGENVHGDPLFFLWAPGQPRGHTVEVGRSCLEQSLPSTHRLLIDCLLQTPRRRLLRMSVLPLSARHLGPEDPIQMLPPPSNPPFPTQRPTVLTVHV